MSDPPDQTRTVVYGAPERVRLPAVTLKVKKGPDSGREVKIEQPVFVVGSGDGADLRLADPGVSRAHLRLTLASSGVRVRDDGSKNGTFFGGARVYDLHLSEATQLTLGATTLAISFARGGLEFDVGSEERFGEALGCDPLTRGLFAKLRAAAEVDATVLLEGESGVGKDVLARAIHTHSARVRGPFATIDCGALSPNLVESELFGHARGAFTGASDRRMGLFEEADGGTLFLDEIGELPLDLQPKLLRALETREIRPVGGQSTRKVDVRIVAATNRRLAEAARKNEFRADLYYRLAVVRVNVPSLRDRPADIVPLATAFFRKARGDSEIALPPEFGRLLASYAWPGNVRELRNVVERFAVFGTMTSAFAGAPTGVASDPLLDLAYHDAKRQAVDRFERGYLPGVLARCGGVVAKAAEHAGIARQSFYRMLERIESSPDE